MTQQQNASKTIQCKESSSWTKETSMARSWHATKTTTKTVKIFLLVGGTPMVGSQHATMTIENENK